jgi:hypothetical protein
VIVNNWQDGKDEIIFAKNELSKNFILMQKKSGENGFSLLQQNMEHMLTFCGQNS